MIDEQMETKDVERGTLAAFQINKDTKRVETLASFNLYDNGQRVYTPAFKPSAADIGAVPKTDVAAGAGYAQLAGKIPRIGTDGVLEVARYIDFHTKDSTADFDVRLDCYDANNLNVTGGKLKVEGNEVYTTGFKPFRVHHVAKPSGAVDGKYYPVVITGAVNNQQVYIQTRQSGGADPMNNCSFDGIVRAMGWSDGTSYAQGMFTQYQTGERAIHCVYANSESEGVYAFYVEARAFPIVVRADSSCSVAVYATNHTNGTSVYPAAVTDAQLTDGSVGTKIRRLMDFDSGNGFYRYDGQVNDFSRKLVGAVNFDDYTSGATYNLYNTQAGSTNSPPVAYGTLLVIGRGTGSNTFVTQIATERSNGITYIRCRTDNGTWSSWKKQYSESAKPTAAELGVVNKAGDTLTGTLTTKTVKIDAGSKLHFPTGDSDIVQIYSKQSGDTFGGNLFITSGGNTVIGSGESAINLESLTNGENLHLTSDGHVDVISGCNTWADRKFSRFNSDGSIVLNSGQTAARMYFGSTTAYVARSGENVYVAANGTGGKVYIEGKANPIARVNGSDYTFYHTGNKPTAADVGALKKTSYNGNLDSLSESGMYNLATGVSAIPSGASGSGDHVIHQQWDSNAGYQIYTCYATGNKGKMWTRSKSGGKWAAWQQVYDSNNKPTASDVGSYTKAEVDSRLAGKAIGHSKALGTEDLDTLKTAGVYHQSANANATTARHYPEQLAGALIVYTAAGIIQEYRVYNSSKLWTRAQYTTGAWTAWARKYDTLNKPTAADVGALPLSGGTVSGVISISEASTASRQFEAKQGTVTGVFRLSDATAIFGTQDGANWTGAIKVGKSDFVYTPNASTWYKVYHQGFKPTAADVGLGNVRNVGWNHGAAADTYAVRDASADITARLFRSNYADESAISGGLAFRKSTTDNYIRFCNNTGAIRTWLGAAPSGYGLGEYGKSISTVLGDNELRRATGFFQGSGIAGLPADGHGWKYVFSQAHGNAAGYFGYLAIDFAGSKAWIGAQEGGVQKGPHELVKRGDSIFAGGRVEINTGANPMLEYHIPGHHAVCQYLDGSGNFRIGTSNGAGGEVTLRAQFATNGELYVNGNVNANDVYIRSDRRMKSDLVKVESAVDKVTKLQAYSYNKHRSLTDNEVIGREVGLIAQDVQKVLPEAVNEAEDTTLTISNSAVNALLVEAIKELKAEIEELKRGKGK